MLNLQKKRTVGDDEWFLTEPELFSATASSSKRGKERETERARGKRRKWLLLSLSLSLSFVDRVDAATKGSLSQESPPRLSSRHFSRTVQLLHAGLSSLPSRVHLIKDSARRRRRGKHDSLLKYSCTSTRLHDLPFPPQVTAATTYIFFPLSPRQKDPISFSRPRQQL